MKPIPGQYYTIVDENSLSQISVRAYGDPQFWPRIWDANQTTLRSGDPDLIFPGESILIPIIPELIIPVTAQANRDPDRVYIEMGGFTFNPVSARISRTLDTVANRADITIPYEAGDNSQFDELILPKSFTPVTVSLGGEPIVTGVLYGRRSITETGRSLTLTIYTATVDLVDSAFKPPYQQDGKTLKDILEKIVKPMGYNIIFDADTGAAFDRATAIKGQKIFDFLIGLARQRAVLLSCNTGTDLVVTQAKTTGLPIATLEEGVTEGVTGWILDHDDRNSFSVYRATGQTPFGNAEATAQDQSVPRTRFTETVADESTAGSLETAAIWARNKNIANTLSFPLNVEGWRNPETGDLWAENELVVIKSKSMMIPDGFTFLINRVEYTNSPIATTLSFVPPTTYTQGEIVEPW